MQRWAELEHSSVGGRCQSVTTPEGFRFDTGPSLLLFPNEYRQTFEYLGAQLEDYVQLVKVQPAAYRVFFAEGALSSGSQSSSRFSSLDLLYDVQAMVQQLEHVEPGAGTQYISWLADARKALVVGTANFIARDFDGWLDFLDLRRLLPLLGQVSLPELLGNHHSRLARRFRDPRLCAMLSFQDLYVGLSPYTAPGVFSLLAATEVTEGVYYPLGGFGKVRDGLLAVLQQAGGRVRTGARVEQINTQGGKVTGVTLTDGEQLPAAVVVSNSDVSVTYGLCDEASTVRCKQQLLAEKDYSAGVIAYYWCVDKRLDGLCHHNVFLSDEYVASWQRARTADEYRQRPNFYVHAPAQTDPTAAPPGCDSIMVLLPVANIQQRTGMTAGPPDDYLTMVSAGRQLVLNAFAAAGIPIAASNILYEEVRDPRQWRETYSLEHGAAFGMAHGLDQLALLRPGPQDEAVAGLFLVGASSRPGNGVPLVMMGGRLTAERILRQSRAST
eukprot:gene5714-5954_t